MRLQHIAVFIVMLTSSAACASARPDSAECDTNSLEEILSDPLAYEGKIFCGDAFILRIGRTVRMLRTAREKPSEELAMIVTGESRHLPGRVGRKPRRFQIKARIDPMESCFQPPTDNGETCVPYTRPVFFHLLNARP
jgi:hypothetical protein